MTDYGQKCFFCKNTKDSSTNQISNRVIMLAKNNSSVIYCDENHMPVTMTMDLESNSIQSQRFQSQLSATIPTNKQLWKQIESKL